MPDIHLDRITEFPAVCDHPTGNTPLGNFEVFTHTWAENYISFELRHADWNQIVAEYRPRINAQTTPTQLFDIFQSMIQPLGDLQTYIGATSIKHSTPTFWRSGTSYVVKDHRGDCWFW